MPNIKCTTENDAENQDTVAGQSNVPSGSNIHSKVGCCEQAVLAHTAQTAGAAWTAGLVFHATFQNNWPTPAMLSGRVGTQQEGGHNIGPKVHLPHGNAMHFHQEDSIPFSNYFFIFREYISAVFWQQRAEKKKKNSKIVCGKQTHFAKIFLKLLPSKYFQEHPKLNWEKIELPEKQRREFPSPQIHILHGFLVPKYTSFMISINRNQNSLLQLSSSVALLIPMHCVQTPLSSVLLLPTSCFGSPVVSLL